MTGYSSLNKWSEMRKVIAFDLDDTLSVTKSPMSERMSQLLAKLLDKYEVCVISGGKIEQFHLQVVNELDVPIEKLNRLHLMPTCGTRYYRFDADKEDWHLQYANDLNDEQKREIIAVLEEEARALGIWHDNPIGEIIEDRHSQITHSALGQQATAEDKYRWSEGNAQLRLEFRDRVAARLPELEVRLGGTTSTDITLKGIDKAYGMQKLMEVLSIDKSDILFIGDKLQEGGNDYPVRAMGIDSIEVRHWEDTAYVIEGLLAA